MSTNDSMRSEGVEKGAELEAYAALFTERVLQRARRRAESFARASRGALSEEDLVQRACEQTWQWVMSSRPLFKNINTILAQCIKSEYDIWARGHNPRRHTLLKPSDREVYFASTSIDDVSEGANPPQLTIGNPVDGWDMGQDIKQALQTLTPKEQEWVYLVYWRGETLPEAGARYGITRQSMFERLQPVLARLRALLADYAPPAHDEKRSRGTRSPSR